MEDNRNSYTNILKAISLFGGLQGFKILVGLINNKIMAVLLGPAGLGFMGLLTSTNYLVEALTGLGLSNSAVRDVSQAYTSGNTKRISIVCSVLRKLVIWTGLLGALIVFALAPQLSIFTFGNGDYTTAFRIVSVTLFFNQLGVGYTILLQGTFHYKYMAQAALSGSVIGVVVSLPFYYFWGRDAVAPVIVLLSFFSMLLNLFYSRKVGIRTEAVSLRTTIVIGKTMILLGVATAITGFVRMGGTYLTRIYISNQGGIVDVGLYLAGMSMTSRYIDLILGAMSTDYMPRLAAIANDKDSFILIINRQIQLLLPIMLPIIIFFLVFVKFAIIVLYSGKFLGIIVMVEWFIVAMFFRAISWCLSYAQVARGDSKAFLINESLSVLYGFVFTVVGYKYFGLTGIGYGFLLVYLCYSIQMFLMAKNRFDFFFNEDSLKTIMLDSLFIICSFALIMCFEGTIIRYIIGIPTLFVSIAIAIKQMGKLIPIKTLILSKLKKR